MGEQELTGEDEAAVDAYFAPDFVLRPSAEAGRRVSDVACQTTIEGTFAREFTHRIVFELMNIFRYDDQGRLAEEWVQADNRSRLRQLGAEGR